MNGCDIEDKFKTQTDGTDTYISLYASYYPEDETPSVYYILHDTNGAERDPVLVTDLTDDECETVRQDMMDAGLEECVSGIQEDTDESEGLTMT